MLKGLRCPDIWGGLDVQTQLNYCSFIFVHQFSKQYLFIYFPFTYLFIYYSIDYSLNGLLFIYLFIYFTFTILSANSAEDR